MRPLKLTIQAMGPYKNSEDIDFTLLGDKKFFLIHGPTGAGKTSILDAMTYALYGDTSGEERSLEQMRSQWADADTESFVEFEFSVGEKIYRVKRRPIQILAKKRGTGTREVPADATLWRLGPDESVVDTGVSKVTRKIESLLGFNSEQFRQVIVLPQGKFRELLSAKAEGREEILKVLFGTERFTKIQNMIRERAAQARRDLDALRVERETVLKGEESASADELLTRSSMRKQEADDLTSSLKKAGSVEKSLLKEMKSASLIESKFSELDTARAAMDGMESRREEILGYTGIIEAAKKAGALADIYSSLKEERKLYADTELALRKSREELTIAENMKNDAEKILCEIPARRAELSDMEQEIFRLEAGKNIYTEIEKTDKEISIHDKRRDDAEKLSRKISEKKGITDNKMEILRDEIKNSELSEAKLPAIKLSIERITAAGKLIADAEKAAADGERLRREIGELDVKFTSVKGGVDEISQKKIKAEERWRSGQASVLARELKSGEPCPVCGSTHHPLPAESGGATPGMEEIEKLRLDESRAVEEMKLIEVELVRKRTELETLSARPVAMDDIPAEYRELSRDDLRKLFKEATEESERVAKKASELDSLRRNFTEVEKASAAAAADAEAAAAVVREAEVALAALRSRRDQLAGNIPDGIADSASLIIRIEEMKKEKVKLNTAISESEKKGKSAAEKFAAADAMYRKTSEDSVAARVRLNAKESDFAGRLEAAGFKTEDEFLPVLGETGKVRELESLAEKYNKEFIEAEGRFNRAVAETSGETRPDIQAIQERIDSVKSEYEEILGRLKIAESESIRLANVADRIRLIDLTIDSVEESFGVIQKLADISGGRNERKLTFQRYVLQSLFDEVLMFASGRLEMMSRGRYRLISPGRVGDRRLAGGLDLEVFDEYTGYSRPVVTLSGGEAFLASLSLALGLADLVQQYAGGIHLDTVFIDEGFGSLDSETLDLAINTLIDLQGSGRLVGIISHVNELKERIDARLEVIPVACGSRTRFIV